MERVQHFSRRHVGTALGSRIESSSYAFLGRTRTHMIIRVIHTIRSLPVSLEVCDCCYAIRQHFWKLYESESCEEKNTSEWFA